MSFPQSCCTTCPDTELVEIPGVAGADGADGADGSNAYTVTTAQINIPAVNTEMGSNATVDDNTWMAVGQYVLVSDGTNVATFRVTSLTGTTGFNGTFVSASGDSAVATVIAAGASVVAAGAPGTGLAGATSPESNVYGSPGMSYFKTDDETVWFKKTGQNTLTGWVQVIGPCIAFLLTIASCWGAPPIVRSEYTTNYFTNASVYITNIVRWMNTNDSAFTNQSLVRNRWAITNDSATASQITNVVRWMNTNDSAFTNQSLVRMRWALTNDAGTTGQITNFANLVVTNHFADMTNASRWGMTTNLDIPIVNTNGTTYITNRLYFSYGILTNVIPMP